MYFNFKHGFSSNNVNTTEEKTRFFCKELKKKINELMAYPLPCLVFSLSFSIFFCFVLEKKKVVQFAMFHIGRILIGVSRLRAYWTVVVKSNQIDNAKNRKLRGRHSNAGK